MTSTPRPAPAKRKKLISDIEDILDGEPPWLTVGFTVLLMAQHVQGMAFRERVRNQWGKADIMRVDK
jgi:hypothetical protein